jgi:hypothetical protein
MLLLTEPQKYPFLVPRLVLQAHRRAREEQDLLGRRVPECFDGAHRNSSQPDGLGGSRGYYWV